MNNDTKTSMQPTEEQQRVIDSDEPWASVQACPGSGKTQTLVWRILHLVRQGTARPESVAVISYTNSASREIASRMEEAGVKIGHVGTLHAFCVRYLRTHQIAGLNPSQFGILADDEAKAMFKDVCAEQSYKATTALWDQSKEYIGKSFVDQAKHWNSAEARVIGCFYKQMRETRMLSFDAILHYSILTAARSAAPGTTQWTHVFVDEGQDMNEKDYAFLRLLNPRSLWAFGDGRQAIFGFRGSDPYWMTQIGDAEHGLTHNFRSNQNICDAASSLIGAAPGSMTGMGVTPGGVSVKEWPDWGSEVRWIVERMANLHRAETEGKPVPSVAVLTRTNAQADDIARAIAAEGVPVQSRRKARAMPEDWSVAKLLVGLCAHPTEQGTAHYLKVRYGMEGIRRAVNLLSSGRSVCAPMFDGTAGLMDVLAKESISPQSVQLVIRSMEQLPPGADAASLLAAMQQAAFETEISGAGAYVGTIHSAKGREWDVVIVPGCDSGAFSPDGDGWEERRRLLYVAMTRARANAVMSWSRNNLREGGLSVTPFLVPVVDLEKKALHTAQAG